MEYVLEKGKQAWKERAGYALYSNGICIRDIVARQEVAKERRGTPSFYFTLEYYAQYLDRTPVMNSEHRSTCRVASLKLP
jgi:hypothetical protein